MAIRVFLLDDHEIVRRGLADLIGLEDDLGTETSHGARQGHDLHDRRVGSQDALGGDDDRRMSEAGFTAFGQTEVDGDDVTCPSCNHERSPSSQAASSSVSGAVSSAPMRS